MPIRTFILATVLLGMLCLAARAEFQIHTNAVKDQEHVAVTQLANGNIVFAWEDESSGASEIWFRRYDSNLVALGLPVRAHNATTNDQAEPAITSLANSFVIAWSARNFDGSDYGIAFRRFDMAGNALDANPVQANTTTNDAQLRPRIAPLTSGGFVLVWDDESGAYSFGSSQDVRYRRFSSSGAAGDPTDLVANAWGTDAHIVGDQGGARVAGLPNNGFVIAYEDRQLDDIFAVVFDSLGNPLQVPGAPSGARQRLVNQATAYEQAVPAIATFPNGSFVVTYNSDTAGTPASRRVLARYFPPSGIGSNEVIIGSFTNRMQDASVAALSNGNFIVAMQALAVGSDSATNAWSVLAQRFSTNDVPQSPSFIVNTYQAGDQDRPLVASLRDGGYIVAWQSFGQDTNRYGVYAQRYSAASEPLGRLLISRLNPVGTNFLVTFTNGAAYVPYRLQAAAALSPPWVTLLTTNTTNGAFQYTETQGGANPARDYRVISH